VNEGVVLAVGPGRRTREGEIIPPAVKEGDKVLLPEYGGSLVKLDSKE
jgi:chaperonin GroES